MRTLPHPTSAGPNLVVELSRLRRAEEALRRSHELFRTVAQVTRDALWEWDLDADLVTWSENFFALYGCPEGEVEPSIALWLGGIHAEDRAQVEDRFRQTVAGNTESWTSEYRFTRADGRQIFVLDRGLVLRDSAGEPSRVIGSLMDVSVTRELQERLARSDRMASLGTLAAGVAHEINNPMAYVCANLDFAVRETTHLLENGSSPEELAESLTELGRALREARSGAERVRVIVGDLKTFSRPDEESLEPIDVGQLIGSAVSMVHGELKHRARVKLAAFEVPRVMGNEARLSQVFLNLLVNAAQAIPEGNPEENEVSISAEDVGQRVHVVVRDTGGGMSEEVRARIFDPFFTTKPVGVGTGLGLAVCHGIVKGLGGDIDVTSTPGKGTCFTVQLPIAELPVVAAHEGETRRRGRILVVDDDPMAGRALRRALSEAHQVEVALDGREALERLAAGARFDVVICDLMMPDLSGMDLHSELQAFAPEQAERFIFLSAGVSTQRGRDFLSQVKNPRMEKPANLTELREVIARLVA